MNKAQTIEQIKQNEVSIFKYKDFTYIKMAHLQVQEAKPRYPDHEEAQFLKRFKL